MKMRWILPLAVLALLGGKAPGLAAQDKARVLEDIVARVNNDIITNVDLERSKATLREEIKMDCPGCTPQQLEATYGKRQQDLLRDLIDQSLLVQRAKDAGINVDLEVVKRLDQIRQQNNFPTMEALEKAVEASGVNYEDYKEQIKGQLLTQDIIRRQVGSRIIIDSEEVKKYYEAHKNTFVRPEQVYLREIFVSTEGKSPAELPALKKKAEDLLQRVKNGEDFGQLAKLYSDGTTAKQSGELGVFERGQLAPELENAVFKLNRNDVTDVIQTKQGFEVLQVEQHYQAGLQPLEKVQDEIMNRLYAEKLQPALRDYLKELRQESYLVVRPGYVDTASVASSPIEETQPAADPGKSKKKRSKKKHAT